MAEDQEKSKYSKQYGETEVVELAPSADGTPQALGIQRVSSRRLSDGVRYENVSVNVLWKSKLGWQSRKGIGNFLSLPANMTKEQLTAFVNAYFDVCNPKEPQK